MNPPVTLANWRSAPFNRWGFQHVRELIPTADIPNDPHRVRELPVQKRNIDGEFLAETQTDALMGLLFGSLGIDPDQPVTDFVPEVGTTAYAGARVRHPLDMRAGVKFEEDYLATSGPIVEYRKASGWNPLGPDEAPGDLHSFYQVLKERDGRHGGAFHYISPNSDLL